MHSVHLLTEHDDGDDDKGWNSLSSPAVRHLVLVVDYQPGSTRFANKLFGNDLRAFYVVDPDIGYYLSRYGIQYDTDNTSYRYLYILNKIGLTANRG